MHAVILAGGQGRRLRPYTLVIPKPLLPVGDLPIIEILIRQLKRHGFNRITISIGHLGEMIRAYLGDGSRYSVRISYQTESQPLGTAGPLGLLEDPGENFLVLNGDLLTDIDFRRFFEEHVREKRKCTIGTFRKSEKIQLGVLKIENELVADYIEKPVTSYDASIGVYAFHRDALENIPRGGHYDLPDLVRRLLEKGVPVVPFRHHGEWLDIGRFDDHAAAEERIKANPARFLGE